jgi:hypothetical protein
VGPSAATTREVRDSGSAISRAGSLGEDAGGRYIAR